MGDSDAIAEFDRAFLWHSWSPVEPRRQRLIVSSGMGCHITDVHGRTYLDLRAGTLNAAVGYRHPRVVQAMITQAEQLMTWDLAEATTVPAARLAARIAELARGDLTRTLLCNSGSEAVEATNKVARNFHALSGHPDRVCILSLHAGYQVARSPESGRDRIDISADERGAATERVRADCDTAVFTVPGCYSPFILSGTGS